MGLKKVGMKPDEVQAILPGFWRTDLGDIESLAADMADHGQRRSVLVSATGQLLSGQRRVEAARHAGIIVNAFIVTTLEELHTEMARQQDHQGLAMKLSEIGAQSAQIRIWDAPGELKRRSEKVVRAWEWRRSGGVGKSTTTANSAEGIYGAWGRAFGINPAQYARLWQTYRRIGNPEFTQAQQDAARAKLQLMEARGSVWAGSYKPLHERGPQPDLTPKEFSAQRNKIDQTLQIVAGALEGLGEVKEIDQAITPRERRRMARDIARLRGTLMTLSKTLEPGRITTP